MELVVKEAFTVKLTEAVENKAAFGGKAPLSPGWQMGPRGGGRVEAAKLLGCSSIDWYC